MHYLTMVKKEIISEQGAVLSFSFLAESVTFTLIPLTGVRVPTRPGVGPAGLVAADPSPLVPALVAGTRTDPVSVGLACRPAAAVSPAVVE